ncbi:MAG: FAD binding domain-containing protein [Spirochaetota bacterium]
MRVDEVASPQSIAECMTFMKRRPEAVVWAGGTALMTIADRPLSDKPLPVLDLHRVQELRSISGSDRYIELGACVSLQSILELPKRRALVPLKQAILGIGNPPLRNMATIGGNIAARSRFMTCFPVLTCLDAALETRDGSGAKWSGFQHIVDADGHPSFPESTLLTRIRIPTAFWDNYCVRPMGDDGYPDAGSFTFAGVARMEKNTIVELRVCAAGSVFVRNRDAELELVGKRLPLGHKETDTLLGGFEAAGEVAGLSPRMARRYAYYVKTFFEYSPDEPQ